ncbi:MAG: sensor histidine kinase [Gemmatimonas sp.]
MSDLTRSKTIRDSATAGASHEPGAGRSLTRVPRLASSLDAKIAIVAITFLVSLVLAFVLLRRGGAAPEALWTLAIFAAAAAIALVVVVGIRGDVLRFARLARAIRSDGSDASIAGANTIPELAPAADEFDRLVRTVRQSASELRDAAEENAHAFKTPIAVIAQSLEPLRRSIPEDDARGRRALQLIERSVDRLDSLVGAARHMDEILASLIDMPRERVNLSALLNRMLQAYRDRMAEHGVTLRMELAPGIVVDGGEENLEVVVENLIENATSFSPTGGTVTVTLSAGDGLARLAVGDEGPGIDPRNLERIFDRYFTHRPGRNDSASHFGIGLWVVRRNVDALGGSVVATNRDDRGLDVTITLPLAS